MRRKNKKVEKNKFQVKSILLSIFVAIVLTGSIIMIFASDRSDCFDEVYSKYPKIFDEDNISYWDMRKGITDKGYLVYDSFMNLPFDAPIVQVEFFGIGDETSLKAGVWPTYHKYNYYELYIDDFWSWEPDFAGCGIIEITPEGSYNYNNLDSSVYGYGDFHSYAITDKDENDDFKILKTSQKMFDTSDDEFITMDIFRVYLKDSGLYMKMYDVFEIFDGYLQDYKSGNEGAFQDYLVKMINDGYPWSKYLSGYKLYYVKPFVSGIKDSKEPTAFVPMSFVKPQITVLSTQINSTDLNAIINRTNYEREVLFAYGFISDLDIALVNTGELIGFDKLAEVQASVLDMLTVIDRDSLFVSISNGSIINSTHYQIINANLNSYILNRDCVNVDFACSDWGTCAGNVLSRSVNRNRVCIGDVPAAATGCEWKVHSYGSVYSVAADACFMNTYRDQIQRDVYSTLVEDYCGVYVMNQWSGHTKTVPEFLGQTFVCPVSAN